VAFSVVEATSRASRISLPGPSSENPTPFEQLQQQEQQLENERLMDKALGQLPEL
jgi:hypothetical protein